LEASLFEFPARDARRKIAGFSCEPIATRHFPLHARAKVHGGASANQSADHRGPSIDIKTRTEIGISPAREADFVRAGLKAVKKK